MTEGSLAAPGAAGQDVLAPGSPLRVAVLDRDSGFLQVLTKRLERLGWEYRLIGSAVPSDTVVAMRLSAVVVDLAVIGP